MRKRNFKNLRKNSYQTGFRPSQASNNLESNARDYQFITILYSETVKIAAVISIFAATSIHQNAFAAAEPDSDLGGPHAKDHWGALLSVCQAYYFSGLNNLHVVPCSFFFLSKVIVLKLYF